MQETTVLFSSADIDQLVLQSSRAICETAEIVLGRKSARDKPWIVVGDCCMSNEKRTLRNKQGQENKDWFKQLKRQIEKKTRQALRDMITKSVSSAKTTSKEITHTLCSNVLKS